MVFPKEINKIFKIRYKKTSNNFFVITKLEYDFYFNLINYLPFLIFINIYIFKLDLFYFIKKL